MTRSSNSRGQVLERGHQHRRLGVEVEAHDARRQVRQRHDLLHRGARGTVDVQRGDAGIDQPLPLPLANARTAARRPLPRRCSVACWPRVSFIAASPAADRVCVAVLGVSLSRTIARGHGGKLHHENDLASRPLAHHPAAPAVPADFLPDPVRLRLQDQLRRSRAAGTAVHGRVLLHGRSPPAAVDSASATTAICSPTRSTASPICTRCAPPSSRP